MTEKAFEQFTKSWREHDPAWKLDQPKVRDQVIALISVVMIVVHEQTPAKADQLLEEISLLAVKAIPDKSRDSLLNKLRNLS